MPNLELGMMKNSMDVVRAYASYSALERGLVVALIVYSLTIFAEGH
jgi:hypothetical protein